MSLNPLTKKRITNEVMDLLNNPLKDYDTYQDESNFLTFYVLFKGPIETDYQGGFYILKIQLASEYPKAPPDYYMLVPSGRFEINKKICITNSGYHRDLWQPTWNLKKMMEGLFLLWLMIQQKVYHISIYLHKLEKQWQLILLLILLRIMKIFSKNLIDFLLSLREKLKE